MTELVDAPESWPVEASEVTFEGHLISVRRDTVHHDASFDREVITHPGAVAVVAADEDGRILVIRQYRHPAQQRMFEVPAGLLDVHGEPPLEAAKRELAEEGLLAAERWTPLATMMPSAGVSTEVIHLFLAEGLSQTPVPDGFEAKDEEASMTRTWEPLDAVVDAVLAGRITSGPLIVASLALWRLRHAGPPTME